MNYTLTTGATEEFVSQAATDYENGLASKAAVMYKTVSDGGGGTLNKTLAIGTTNSSEGRDLAVALLLQGGGVQERDEVEYGDDEC